MKFYILCMPFMVLNVLHGVPFCKNFPESFQTMFRDFHMDSVCRKSNCCGALKLYS